MERINIIGAGLAGLSAAITLAESGRACRLVSLQQSERAQSVLAEGGINGALDTMGEGDSTELHFEDTMRGGVYLADPNAVENLVSGAPDIIRWLEKIGVPFNRGENDIMLRSFGGQRRKRTAYARSSTGKIIMTAVIDEARKHEASGLIERFPHHEFIRLLLDGAACVGVRVKDTYSGTIYDLDGEVILACGGMNGIFPEMTTGTTQNTGDCTAVVFSQGLFLGNLEMLQYHPTTIGISGKRCLVTEAARGEGGRLFVKRNGEKWYFMEEKYPELGNLMPRDVVSREMYFVRRQPDCEAQIWLDMTGLSEEIWKKRLSDLRQELTEYLSIDPGTEPIPVKEGIHYFMGGIDTDEHHRTNIKGVYSAGECACQYHGANRLGGNSMLGALFGGKKAAQTVISEAKGGSGVREFYGSDELSEPARPEVIRRISKILLEGMGIVRSEEALKKSVSELKVYESSGDFSAREICRFRLAEAMLTAALERRESRGAHYREDYPEKEEDLCKTSLAKLENGRVSIFFRELPARRAQHENKA